MVAVAHCADRRTDGWTDGRYQVHYLPASLNYAVDKYGRHGDLSMA